MTYQTEKNLPDFYVFSVQGNGRGSIWTKIGAAWKNKDGEGVNIHMDAMPFNFDGKLVLRKPITNSEVNSQTDSEYNSEYDLEVA